VPGGGWGRIRKRGDIGRYYRNCPVAGRAPVIIRGDWFSAHLAASGIWGDPLSRYEVLQDRFSSLGSLDRGTSDVSSQISLIPHT
jgi:hypothetical protein